MKNYIQKIFILIITFTLLTSAHERHEEVVPELNKVLIEKLLSTLEAQKLEPKFKSEKNMLAIEWMTWLIIDLELDKKVKRKAFFEQLSSIYSNNTLEERSYIWEHDMQYICNIADLSISAIKEDVIKKELESLEEKKKLSEKEEDRLGKLYYFMDIKHKVRTSDIELLKPFISRIKKLIKNREKKGLL